MKRILTIALLSALSSVSVMAQDDMYFIPKSKAQKQKEIEKEEADRKARQLAYIRARSEYLQNVDRYNRRGKYAKKGFSSNYEVVSNDSTGNDVIDFTPGNGQYPDSLSMMKFPTVMSDSLAILNAYSAGYTDGYEDGDDYKYSRSISLWDTYYGPYYWSRYNTLYWNYPYNYYSSYWYDPWFYDSWYYDPWYYGGYYGWGYYYGHRPWHGYYGYGHWGSYNGHPVVSHGGGHRPITATGGVRQRDSWGDRRGSAPDTRTGNRNFSGARNNQHSTSNYSDSRSSWSNSSSNFSGSRSSSSGSSFSGGSRGGGGGSFSGGGSRGGGGGSRGGGRR